MTLFRTGIYSISIMIFLLTNVLGFSQLSLALSVCAIVSIAISLPRSGWIASCLAILFLGLGLAILWKEAMPTSVYLTSFGGMFNLLALFSIIPLIAVPIRIGGYSDTIRHVLETKIKGPSSLYRTISFYSFFLSCFMNLATLPMMYYSVKRAVEHFPIKNTTRFTSIGIIQGFSLPILWTPIAPIVGVVFDLTHVSWLSMLPLLLALSFVGLFINWGLYEFNRKRYEKSIPKVLVEGEEEIAAALANPDPVQWRNKLLQMAFAVVLFILSIAMLEHMFPIGLITTVIILTVPFALIWSLLLGQTRAFFKEVAGHFQNQLPKMSDQFAIFLSAGFFVAALQVTGSNSFLNEAIINLDHLFGPQAFLAILPLVPLLLAFLGMHPALAIGLLAESLEPASLGISAEQLALALLGGAVSTFLLGPFNATSGIMSSIMKVSPFRIVAWNVGYSIAFLLMIVVALLII